MAKVEIVLSLVRRAEATGAGQLTWPALRSKPATVLLQRPGNQFATDVSRDGSLVFTEQSPDSASDIWIQPPDSEPVELRATRYNEGGATLSPDEHWLAYTSDESGPTEVYVQPFPGPGEPMMVSRGGGAYPRWSDEDLFYATGGALMAVARGADGTFGTPRQLFDHSIEFRGPYFDLHPYDVSPDGKRFLVIHRDEGSIPNHLNVILNWPEELARLVPLD